MINKRVNLIITHKCNLYCEHCYMNASNDMLEDSNIILEKLINITSTLKSMGVNEILITGGECTISPVIEVIINHCLENGFKVSIFTNGMVLPQVVLDKVDSINISVDGLKENHNKLRGNKKSFDNVVKHIKKLNSANKKINVQTTITNENLFEVSNIIQFLYKLGIKKINLCCLLADGRSKTNKLTKNIDVCKLNEIILGSIRKTGYNVEIKTNLFDEFSTNMFLKNESIDFPLWIDLINDSYYLIKDKSIFAKNIIDLSENNVVALRDEVNKFILKNIDLFNKKEYYILENEILKILENGGGSYE